jgi:hypothetical protein
LTTILRDLFGPGTWGNVVAAVLLGALGALSAWLGRNKIGRSLAAWWAKHLRKHAIEHHQEAMAGLVALVEQLRAEVEALRALVTSQRGEGQG